MAVLLAAAALRAFDLGHDSLWMDELASVQFASQPLGRLWSQWMVAETNPPLYYSLLHVWVTWFGSSEVALRSLSLLAGVGVVGMTYTLGARLFDKPVTLVACVFTALSSAQIGYSQDARAAIFAQLAALVALWGAWRFTESLRPGAPLRGSVRWLLVYATGCLPALYLHTTMFALPVLANAFVFALAARRRAWNRPLIAWVGANLVCLAGWSWWLAITLEQLRGASVANIAWIPKPGVRALLNAAAQIYTGQTLGAWMTWTMALAFVLVGRYVWRHRGTAQVWLLVTVVAGAPLLLWVISQWTPILLVRTILWAQAPYFLLLSASLADLGKRHWRWSAIGLAMLLLLMDTVRWETTFGKEPWREAIAMMGRWARPGDAILVVAPSFGGAALYYTRQLAPQLPVIAVDDGRQESRWGRDTFDGQIVAPGDVPGLLGAHPRLWLLEHQTFTPQPALRSAAVQQNAWQFLHRPNAPLLVSLWARRVDPTSSGEQVSSAPNQHDPLK